MGRLQKFHCMSLIKYMSRAYTTLIHTLCIQLNFIYFVFFRYLLLLLLLSTFTDVNNVIKCLSALLFFLSLYLSNICVLFKIQILNIFKQPVAYRFYILIKINFCVWVYVWYFFFRITAFVWIICFIYFI